MRSPRQRWGTCCPFDPECEHSFIEDLDDLTRWMDTPISDDQAREIEGTVFLDPYDEAPYTEKEWA